jgi:hypothetical protein
MSVMKPDAAGIDIGATEIFVAVPADRTAENVRSSPTFTQDFGPNEPATPSRHQRHRGQTVSASFSA